MSNSTYIRYEVKGLKSRFDGSIYEWIVRGVCQQPSPWHSSVLAHFSTEAEAKAYLQNIKGA